jgi:hypothetical protein
MSKESLSETVTIDEEVGTSDIVTGAPSSTLQPISGAGIVGEVDQTDVRFPRLQIVQGVGPLSEVKEFSKGNVILDGEYKLSEGDETPVEFTVCQIGKQYEENLPYDSEDIPRIVNTQKEVNQLGGTTRGAKEDGKYIPPSWKAIADALIAIKAPDGTSKEDLDMYFPFAAPDKSNWSFARWVIKGVAYKAAAVEIFSAAQMYYRDGLKKGTFMLTTQKKMFGPNAVMVPVVRKGNRNSDELSSWLSTLA